MIVPPALAVLDGRNALTVRVNAHQETILCRVIAVSERLAAA
jgi:hypothetical protein